MIGWLSDRVSRLAALRLCGAVGRGRGGGAGHACRLRRFSCSVCCSSGAASRRGSIRSRSAWRATGSSGGDLVSVNAAMIIAYGLGALVGPPLGGAAMDLRNPQGLPWLFVALFAGLLGGALLPGPIRRGLGRKASLRQ